MGLTSEASTAPDPEAISHLLKRRELAATRIRGALGRQLNLPDPALLVLAHLDVQGQLTPTRIGALLDLSSGGVTALVQRLERDGHVTREAHPTDRRSSVIRLTPEAVRHGADAAGPVAHAVDALTASLGAGDRRVIHDFLERVASLTEEHASRLWNEHDDTCDAPPRPVPSLWA